MAQSRTVFSLICAALVCAGVSTSTAQGQDVRGQIHALGTTVLTIYVLVNCKYLEASDAELIIADERSKLTGFDPGELSKIVASARRQADAQTTPQACTPADRRLVYQIQQAAQQLRANRSAQHASTQPANEADLA